MRFVPVVGCDPGVSQLEVCATASIRSELENCRSTEVFNRPFDGRTAAQNTTAATLTIYEVKVDAAVSFDG
jgi:hypothetical protein